MKKSKPRYFELRKSVTRSKALDVGDLMARELKRIERLSKESEQVRRRLARARMRYSVLKRLATSVQRVAGQVDG